jgi:hypothetical protein
VNLVEVTEPAEIEDVLLSPTTAYPLVVAIPEIMAEVETVSIQFVLTHVTNLMT